MMQGNDVLNGTVITKFLRHGCIAVASLVISMVSATVSAEQAITDISFNAQPNGQLSIALEFDSTPSSEFSSYTIEDPARIVIDFPETENQLPQRRYALPSGNASSVVVLAAGNRSRMIVNLARLGEFDAAFDGRRFVLDVGADASSSYAVPAMSESALVKTAIASPSGASAINDLEFRRGSDGEGQLILSLSDSSVDVNVFSEGSRISLELMDTEVAESLSRRYDVTDFATPVSEIEVTPSDRGARVVIQANGYFDYLAYQQGGEYVVSVKPLSETERDQRLSEFSYVGDRISLNFQNIEVRAVLQLIADFTDLNLVASDTVEGNITLRLQNVPWDQAMELVLKTKGLDSRQVGNVLMVAPASEIAERERQEIEANKQLAELAPLKSEFIQIRYAKAANVVTLFDAGSEQGGSLVSGRGSVVVDDRTNSIIVTDTAAKLDEIRALIENVDVPIRQVMIEARIVIASSDVDEQLGIKWGGGYFESDADSVLSVARNIETTTAINQAVLGGTAIAPPTAPFVDLGIASATSGFALGFTSNDLFLSAELAALEAAGEGEVVSQPKVITGDKQQATIKSGTEIPYQEGAASGATTTQFKEAVLKLDVTPNITPDDRILLDLVVNQDSVGELVPSANGGVVPSINTTELTTQVLVGNGETVVLGGVFKNEETIQVQKVPVLGDLPGVGPMFRSTVITNKKVETLIFITPRILSEVLLD
ncbi:MAG: type IV pilus secretin PilQ [Gammaproteobacteria bacterium]|nr:type IV pilus secretin PilQ [Gammaproteobacteria bacterium]